MKKLTPWEERDEKLLNYGIPKPFIDNIGKIDELEFLVEEPKGAYFYFPTMLSYTIFSNVEVTPIYDCGEIFYALFEKDNRCKIVKLELENDQIDSDYGQNWDLLLMDIMIEYYDAEAEDGIELEKFKNVGLKIGFNKAEKLFKLRDLSIEEYNLKFEENEKWRIEIANRLGIL
jgi:hypothetical protein